MRQGKAGPFLLRSSNTMYNRQQTKGSGGGNIIGTVSFVRCFKATMELPIASILVPKRIVFSLSGIGCTGAIL